MAFKNLIMIKIYTRISGPVFGSQSVHSLRIPFQNSLILTVVKPYFLQIAAPLKWIKHKLSLKAITLTLYLIETPFNTFANRADPYMSVLVGAAWSGFTVCLWKYDLYEYTKLQLLSF